jgi:hypothetical protein
MTVIQVSLRHFYYSLRHHFQLLRLLKLRIWVQVINQALRLPSARMVLTQSLSSYRGS